MVDDAPVGARINHAQFVAACPDVWHRPRVRQAENVASLQASQQEARFDASLSAKWRRRNGATQPDDRFVVGAHRLECMSDRTSSQALPNIRFAADGGWGDDEPPRLKRQR